WWYAYDAYAPEIFNRRGLNAPESGGGAAAAAIALSLWRAAQRHQATTYGSARWASRREIKRAGLLGRRGVFVGILKLGLFRRRYLRHDGPEHVFVFAPTRSGKTAGLVVPTML